MPTLKLHLFGHFQLFINGEPVTGLQQTRLQAMLAYLLLRCTTPQSRQHVAFVFWPDSTETQARANLRKALYELRRALPDLDRYFQIESQYLQLQESATVYVDVIEFEELLAQANQVGQPPAGQNALEQAVGLYTGELLPACYDEWALRERERLHQRYLDSLEQLVRLLEGRRDYNSAILHAQQLVQADPLQESTYRTLMRLHLQMGDRARALRVYHACTTAMQQELGVEPGPETQAAYQRLLNIENVHVSQPAPRGELPLVGRKSEWEALQSAWRSASCGQPHFVLIAGEAGIGKTRLAEELLQWADQQGHVSARSRSYAAEGQLAYAPVADWLRAGMIRTRLARLERVWLSEVARLLPELLVERPDLTPPQPLADSWQRQHFREALARVFSEGEKPLLLVLDDLQWCDRETLEWLHYLLRFATQARLLVVGTVRPEEVAADHPLHTLLTNLRQEGKLLELELAALDATETSTLAALAAGHQLDREQSASVYAETEGHPLFVVEMMRASDDGAKATLPASTVATTLPPKVHAIIHSRLLQLSPPARELVELAATTGRAFTVEVLARAGSHADPEGSQRDEEKLVAGLDELWQRRIIREQGNNAYDFSHDKIREAAYAGISPARRRLYHRRVAQALEYLHATELDGVSGQVAAHYELAALPEKAILFYQRAADVAQRVYAHMDVVANLTTGIMLVNHLPRTAERMRQKFRLQFALGVSLMTLKGTSAPELKELYLQAYEMAVQVGDELEQLVALAGLHMIELTSGNVQAAYELSQHEIALAERVGNHSRLMEARGKLGIAMFHLGQWRASRNYLEQIVAYSDYQWSEPSHPIPVLHWGLTNRRHLAIVMWHLGYPDQALETMKETLALAQELAHPYTLAGTLSNYAWLHHFRREAPLAQAQAHSSLVLAQQRGFRDWLAPGMAIEGWALAQQGQVDAGIMHMERGLAGRSDRNKLRQPGCLALLAETYGNAGQPEQGLRLLDEALALTEATSERFSEAELHRLKGELLRMQGAAEPEVEAYFLQALATARQQEAKSLELRAATSLARLWQQEKRLQAHDLLAEVYDWFEEGFDTADLIDAKALLETLS